MNKYVRRRCMSHNSILYVGIDVHERESQVAVLEKSGKLLLEDRVPTGELEEFISSIEGKKHVAIESVGFIHPIYERVKHRRGEKKAIIAVARKLVSYAYWMLKRNITYEELHPWLFA